VSVLATVDGRPYQFASTHLESGNAAGLDQLRAVQASELAAALGTGTPTILMGDLNDQPGSPMYQALLGAGYTDLWTALRPGVKGFTCCHATDLSNQVAAFTQRIDYILARGLRSDGKPPQGSVAILGDQPSDRVMGPEGLIWPSDHAGLAADLLQSMSP
jgi:endonuclease/exonuclease/phosphatase family metal-dependent hydrolase